MGMSMMRRGALASIVLEGPTLYGSGIPSTFLIDAANGDDSLDIIVIGDSNAGSNDYGYTVGWDRYLGYELGCDMYATPLLGGGGDYILSGQPTRRSCSRTWRATA